MIVPEGADLNEITPVQFVDISGREVMIPHLDWRTIDGNLTKYDVFASDTYKMLRDLQDKTGVPLKDIPFNDENVLRFFREAGASGGEKLEGITNVRVTEFPEYNSDCSWKIPSNVIIESFSDLMRVYAMQQGTGCMEENAERMMENGRKLKDMISYRDDIMLYLESKGVEHMDAYRIMESVRKGQRRRKRANIDEDNDIMRKAGVPEWYIEACDRISYLTTKAQAASYAMRAWRMAYYKVYYPDDFDIVLKRTCVGF